eukprot:4850856-Pleurochrysis_carterae.AAC.1
MGPPKCEHPFSSDEIRQGIMAMRFHCLVEIRDRPSTRWECRFYSPLVWFASLCMQVWHAASFFVVVFYDVECGCNFFGSSDMALATCCDNLRCSAIATYCPIRAGSVAIDALPLVEHLIRPKTDGFGGLAGPAQEAQAPGQDWLRAFAAQPYGVLTLQTLLLEANEDAKHLEDGDFGIDCRSSSAPRD